MIKINTKVQTKLDEKPFPKLMISKNDLEIVLFTKPESGFSFTRKIYIVFYDMTCFEDYNEPLTIQNE
jgi:hypothetical protein